MTPHVTHKRKNLTATIAPRPDLRDRLGLCQWFHYQDYEAVGRTIELLAELNVRHLRTGISWADFLRPGGKAWYDRQMEALRDFDVTVTFCFTPEHRGLAPHHTSAPQAPEEFAEFCAAMVRRYGGGSCGRDRFAPA